MRLGQKNTQVRQWAKKGTRPRQPADGRYANGYMFGAVCPERAVGAALAMPRCDTQAMQAHLEEISTQVSAGAHAILILDQAAWHTTSRLQMPANISLLCLPPRSPELNPMENIWQYLRQTWLANRVFESYEQIVDALCEAWNKLINMPERIKSITQRQWAKIHENP